MKNKGTILVLMLLLIIPMTLAGSYTLESYNPDPTDRIQMFVNDDFLTVNLDGGMVSTFQFGIVLNNGSRYTLDEGASVLGYNYSVPLVDKMFGQSYYISIQGLTTPHKIIAVTQDRYSGIQENEIIEETNKLNLNNQLKIDFTPIKKDNQTYLNNNGQIIIGGFDPNQNFIYIDPDATLGDSANLDDTRIRQSSPSNNFGTSDKFHIQSSSGNGQIFLIKWNISEANMPSNATNIQTILNVTTGSSTQNTVVTAYDSLNTTWQELVLTWNNFFCNTNSTGQIVVNAMCSVSSTGHTLLGNEFDISQLNLTGWLSVGDTIKTIVIGPSTNDLTQWIGRSSDFTNVSQRPSLTITWDETEFINDTAAINITPDTPTGGVVNFTSSTATIGWTTNNASNSTINYGLTANNLNLVQESSSLVTNHLVTLTGLDANTQYFFNITSAFNPSQTIGVFNFTTAAFNVTITVIPSISTAEVRTNSTSQTNSSIAYGIIEFSPTNINNDFGFKFDRSQTLTALSANTLFFAEQTMCDLNSTCSTFFYNFTTLTVPEVEATLTDTLDLSSCLDRTQDLVLFPENNLAYVYGEDANAPFTTDKIAVVNITDPTNMFLIQCFSTGTNTGFGSGNLNLMPSVTLVDSWLFANGDSTSRPVLVQNDGLTLSNNGTLVVPMGGGAPRTPTNDFAFWSCGATGDTIYETLVYTGTSSGTAEFTTGFSATCEGFMFPVENSGFKGAYYLAEGTAFFDSNGMIASYSGGTHALGGGTARDVFDVNGNNIIASNGNSNRYIYNPATNNATFSSGTSPSGVNCFLKGSSFIAADQVLYLQICSSGGRKPELRVNNLGQTTTNSVINLTQNSQTYGTLEYAFPHAFVVVNNAGNSDLLSFEVISSESQAGINKKPVIENVRPETNPVQTDTSIATFYDVNNPETATLNENILTANSCSYAETENFLQDFSSFNFSTCGQAIIGTRKGVEFGNALDMTQCSSDVISAGATYTQNMIVSFDIYATVDSTAEIEILQTDGPVLTTLFFDITNDTLTMLAGSQTILTNISTTFASQPVPTRIFLQMTPSTTNSNLVNRIYYSTNYFALNDNVHNTFCDTTEFCYIGNFATVTTNMNDFRALGINSATGDMALDNLRVVTTPEYPAYTATTTINNINAACFYDLTGTNINRIYASDTVYGHNYLGFTNVTYTVNQVGTIVTPVILNDSIGGLINEIVAVGGFTDDFSLLILSLIFLLSATVGAFWNGMEAIGIIFMDGIMITLFFFLGWVPLSVFVIVILLAAAMVAMAGRSLFVGGGE